MDLRQIRSFRAVYQLGSLSKASDGLHLAQPALSRQIQLLEHDLKVPLFVRTGRGMTPTDEGKLLFERTAGFARQLEQVREDILSLSSSPTGEVVIGMVPTVSSALTLNLVNAVVQRYPNIKLRVVDAYGSYLVKWLHEGQIDLGIIFGPTSSYHLQVEPIITDTLQVVGNHATEFGAPTVDVDWLAQQPLVLPSRPHALRVLIDGLFDERQLTPRVLVEADSFQALLDLVEGGIGLSFLPYYSVAQKVKGGTLRSVGLNPALHRQISLALPYQRTSSLATKCVADIVREALLEMETLSPAEANTLP